MRILCGILRKESFKKGGQPDGKPHYVRSHASARGRSERPDARGKACLAPPTLGDHLSSADGSAQSRGHCKDGGRLALDRAPRHCYLQARGVAAIETPGKGGRRHQHLTLEQERAVLQPFLARAARGEMATAAEIQRAFEEEAKQPVAKSTIYRLLDRHGWRQLGAGASAAQAPQRKLAQGNTGSARERRKQQSPPKGTRELSLQGYQSSLTDQEWAILSPLIPPAKPGGRPRTVDMRAVLNALLYVDRTGCQWRALPHDFAPWSTVWTYFRTWRNDGTWKRLHTALREQVRVSVGREPTPSAAIIDSQSVKTSQKGGLAGMTAARK